MLSLIFFLWMLFQAKALTEDCSNKKISIDSLKQRLNVATKERAQYEQMYHRTKEDLEKKVHNYSYCGWLRWWGFIRLTSCLQFIRVPIKTRCTKNTKENTVKQFKTYANEIIKLFNKPPCVFWCTFFFTSK